MQTDNIFSTFAKPLRRAIQNRGFLSPTDPQLKAIPLILEGRNILLVAPTGTGKTEAAFLPIFDILYSMEQKTHGIKVIYISPLRALNRDLLERLQWWCKHLDIKIAVRHGDTDVKDRGRQALAPPEILITTPETLQAILPGSLMQRHMMSVKFVIVDEVHELADDKRGSQLTIALERLRELVRQDFQVIGLSATIGTPEKVASFLVGNNKPCEIVRVPVARSMQLEIVYPEASPQDYKLASKLLTYPEVAARLRLIKSHIQDNKSILIFTNTRSEAETLANRFRIWDIDSPIGLHHGSLSKPTRVNTEIQLKEGKLHGVICTSSLEMGIDIGSLEMIIQYNSPRQVSRLVQRVGRSGHTATGTAKGVIITQDSDDTLESLVIARRAYEELLEPVSIPEVPLDVLAHQIAGLLLHSREWEVDEVLRIVRRAYPFASLSEDDLTKVLEYMNSRYPRTAWLSDDKKQIRRPLNNKQLYKYYFENLSMIPDEKHYLVLKEDETPVGVLDEAFVAEHGEPGTKFVEGGSVWQIIQVYHDRIYVSPQDDQTGAIPSWVGEEIPVPFEIAQEVGMIRRKVGNDLGVKTIGNITQEMCEKYPAKKQTIGRALSEMKEQVEKALPLPTDRRITIEKWENFLILNCCLGHLVNRTLSRLLAHKISAKTGSAVGVQQDPYRIVIKSPSTDINELKPLLLELAKEDIEALFVSAMTRTGTFKRRILHVAKKFGAISKDADITSIRLSNIIEGFRDSAIFEEAVRTVLRLDSDLETTARVLSTIDSGEMEVILLDNKDQLTPISRIGMEKIGRKSDLIPPQRLQKILFESTKARLLSEARTLVCTQCWDHVRTNSVKELKNDLKCHSCGSTKIGLTEETEQRCILLCEKTHAKSDLPKNYRRLYKTLVGSASLVSKYGFVATVVLAGKRIPLSDIEKILQKESNFNDALAELIMKAERKALKRRFFGS
ncbi:MAG: DEAD/DEAH box helicase [Nitrososphaerales archaeon]